MSYTLAPITLTLGATASISLPGAGASVSYIKLTNASPYLVELTNLVSGQDYLEPGECNVWQVNGQTTAIQATPQTLLIIPGVTFSAALIVTWFVAGEPAPGGTYPVNFNMLQYIGNSVMSNSATNTLEQDMLTPFVLSGLVATKDGSVPNQLNVTSGVAYPRQSDSSLLRQALTATSFVTTAASSVYFLDLNPDGSWSWGTSHSTQSNYLTIAQVTTDGSGNISLVTDERQLNTTLIGTAQTEMFINGSLSVGFSIQFGAPVSGAQCFLLYDGGQTAVGYYPPEAGASAEGHYFSIWTGTSAAVPLSIGGQYHTASSWVDSAGVLHAPAPVTLTAGNQETDGCGRIFQAAAANEGDGYYVPFKCHMTNVPTSITLTVSSSGNVKAGTPTATNITRDGFLFFVEAAGAGVCNWQGTYTTVGN